MSTPAIMLDGYVINDYFNIGGISRPWPQVTADTVDVSGRAGVALRGTSVGARSVSFRIGAADDDHQRLMGRFQWLIELLLSSDTHTLSFSDEGGMLRTVALDGAPSYEEYENGALTELSFIMPDPYRVDSRETRVTVPSGGSVTFRCSHDNPSIVVSAASAVRDATSEQWGIRFDGGDFVRVELPTGDATAVAIDCLSRHVTVGGSTSMITLYSDWPHLSAGAHTAEMDVGTGAATLVIRERCL